MAAMAKIVARAESVPWYHDIVNQNTDEPAESDAEIMERIKTGLNKIGGSNNGSV